MSFNKQIYQFLDVAGLKRKPLTKITNALRLINGAGDGLDGLVVEQYNKHFVAQIFDPFWLQEKASLKEYLEDHYDVDYLILKDRTQSTASVAQAIPFEVVVAKAPSQTTITEHGIHFEVDLNDTLNTGLFLDMRANRKLVAQSAKDKKVLNGFSYTCSFGLYAKMHGAREVVNVDISAKVLKKGVRNYELNAVVPGEKEFMKADALVYLQKAGKVGNMFDLIILDPPSFARNDQGVFHVEKNLQDMLGLALAVLSPKGQMFVSTNLSTLSHAKLEEVLRHCSVGRKIKNITRLGQDIDFVGSGKVKESYLAALWVEFI